MARFLVLPVAALVLASCHSVPETIYSRCDAISSADWKARVESYQTEHNRPLTRRRFVVTGEVTVPTGGYAVSLDEGHLQRIRPRRLQLLLRTAAPAEAATQARTTERVTGVFPYDRRVEGFAIRCGDGIIADIPRIER
jgi:hypothetical protein